MASFGKNMSFTKLYTLDREHALRPGEVGKRLVGLDSNLGKVPFLAPRPKNTSQKAGIIRRGKQTERKI